MDVVKQAILDPTMTLGSISSGSYSDTLISDDIRLCLADTTGSPTNKYKLDFTFDGVSPTDQWDDYPGFYQTNIDKIEIILEARDSLEVDDYYVMLWNFDNSTWDEVGTVMSIGTTEDTYIRNITTNFASYLNEFNEIKIRIVNGKALGKGGAPDNNGLLEIDYLAVTISNNPGWLTGWDKRIKIIADCIKVDNNLSHFPLTVFLKAGNGETTKVFDEIGLNFSKMAVTKSDGTTQLYVEVEKWDNGNKVGVLHCGLSGDILSSSANTDYYIYYDNDHADNTDYVGSIDSTPGHSVWDSNFACVLHMVDYDSSHIHDSTSNGRDGTKKAANQPNEVSGKIANAQDFAGGGADHHVKFGFNVFDFLANNSYTIDFILKPDELPVDPDFDRIIDFEGRIATIEANGEAGSWRFVFYNGSSNQEVFNNAVYATGSYIFFTAEWDKSGNFMYLYLNGGNAQSAACTGTPDTSQTTRDNTIGIAYDTVSREINGIIDEVRISIIRRGLAWSKATYNSLYDSLLTYGSEELVTPELTESVIQIIMI